MEDIELRKLAMDAALELPGAELHQFAPDWIVARVHGKWFAVTTSNADRSLVNVKVDPEDVAPLIQTYDDVLPGFHMNKKHWVSLRGGPSLTDQLVRELVVDSYRLVHLTLPVRLRPVDPFSFGMDF